METVYRVWGLRKALLILQNIIFNTIFCGVFKNHIRIFGFPIIYITKGSNIKIGKSLTLASVSYFNQVGVNHPVIIRTNSPNARIEIGNNVGISGSTISAVKEIVIGNNVLIGSNCVITDNDFHPLSVKDRQHNKHNVKAEKVYIGNDVFIGMNSIILKGTQIGDNSVIGAGSVVTKDIPPNCIAAGNPARIISNFI